MSGVRRSKRKAAEAALDAIQMVTKQEAASESEYLKRCIDRHAKAPEFTGAIAVLPEHVFVHVLGFLDKRDLVHRASLVSHAWLNATKVPFLWPALDADIWRTYSRYAKKPISSMARFYHFLSRPQFSSLKKLVPRNVRQTRFPNIFERIAAIFPQLEEIDLSGCTAELLYCVVPSNHDLLRLPTLFPKLTKLSLCTRFLTNDILTQFLERMGERLVKLRLFFGIDGDCVCSDAILEAIGRHCPNLENLRYGFHQNGFTGAI